MTLEVGPRAQTISIIDDEGARAKDLWDAIDRLHTSSNEQTIPNPMREPESLESKEGSKWEEHLNRFHDILGSLASLEKAIPEHEKSPKLIRTLPEHIAPLAMVSTNMKFDLINAVQTEISRRYSKGSVSNNVAIPKKRQCLLAGISFLANVLSEDASQNLVVVEVGLKMLDLWQQQPLVQRLLLWSRQVTKARSTTVSGTNFPWSWSKRRKSLRTTNMSLHIIQF